MARYLRIEMCKECPHLAGEFYNEPHGLCALAPGDGETQPQPPIPEWCRLERAPAAKEDRLLAEREAEIVRLQDITETQRHHIMELEVEVKEQEESLRLLRGTMDAITGQRRAAKHGEEDHD